MLSAFIFQHGWIGSCWKCVCHTTTTGRQFKWQHENGATLLKWKTQGCWSLHCCLHLKASTCEAFESLLGKLDLGSFRIPFWEIYFTSPLWSDLLYLHSPAPALQSAKCIIVSCKVHHIFLPNIIQSMASQNQKNRLAIDWLILSRTDKIKATHCVFVTKIYKYGIFVPKI